MFAMSSVRRWTLGGILLAALLLSGCVQQQGVWVLVSADEVLTVTGDVCASWWDCSRVQRMLKSRDLVRLLSNKESDQFVIVAVPPASGWTAVDNLHMDKGEVPRLAAVVVRVAKVAGTDDSQEEIAILFPGIHTTVMQRNGDNVLVWVPELNEIQLPKDAVNPDPLNRIKLGTIEPPAATPAVSLDAAVEGQNKVVESLTTQKPLTLTEDELSSLLTLQMRANYPVFGDIELLANFAPGKMTLTLKSPGGTFYLVGNITVNDRGLLEVKLQDAASELDTGGGTAALKATPEMLAMVEGIANRALATYYVGVQQNVEVGDGVLIVSVKK